MTIAAVWGVSIGEVFATAGLAAQFAFEQRCHTHEQLSNELPNLTSPTKAIDIGFVKWT